jgi:hypothetical protein
MQLGGIKRLILGKGKVFPVVNYLSTTPLRRMGELMYRSTVS